MKVSRLLAIMFLLYLSGKILAAELHPEVQKGIELHKNGRYDSAIAIFQKNLKLAQAKKDLSQTAFISEKLGRVYSDIGEVVKAMGHFQQAMHIFEQQGNQQQVAHILKNIGVLYEEQKDFETALSYYLKAEQAAEEIQDTLLLADCANNRGVVYEQQQKYSLALSAYHKALKLYQKLNREMGIALTYNNIGIVYKYQGDYSRSIDYYQKSLALSEKLNEEFFMAANLNNLGNVYALQKNYPKAIDYNYRSLAIAQKIKATNIVIEAYSSLAEHYAKMGNFAKAFELQQKYIEVNNAHINLERAQQMAELQTKYETAKKEQEITSLKQEKKINSLTLAQKELLLKTRNYQMAGVGGIVLLLGIVGYLLYNRQRLRAQQLRERAVIDAEYKERMRIARDVHDDLGSGLSRITLMAELAKQKIQEDQILSKEILSISHLSKELVENMRDLIWILNPENTKLEILAARIRECVSESLEVLPGETILQFPRVVPDLLITREAQRNIFLTVKEAVHNCIKHANATQISVSFEIENENLQVRIKDNGQGFKAEELTRRGNGLKNMSQRIKAIAGNFHLESSPDTGTSIDIRIPLQNITSTLTKKYHDSSMVS